MNYISKSTPSLNSCIIALVVTAMLLGCGGGGGAAAGNGTSANGMPTPAQVAAITPSQIAAYSDAQIVALDVNIKYLSDVALNALSQMKNLSNNLNGQVESITAAQFAVLTPAQVRMIGTGSGTTSQIQYLSAAVWAVLGNDPAQVAAITPAEIATLWDSEIVALGANINALSYAALNGLSPMKDLTNNLAGQIESITPLQIGVLTPAQVRMIGALSGGIVSTSMIQALSNDTWIALGGYPAQVAAITPAEIATLPDSVIVDLGTNINSLSDAALGTLSPVTNLSTHLYGQIESLTAAQIGSLTPAQVGIIARLTSAYGAGTAIATLNVGAFGYLNATQVAVLTPANVTGVSATQLASLTPTAIAGLAPATIASLTVVQKASLSGAQHTACGC